MKILSFDLISDQSGYNFAFRSTAFDQDGEGLGGRDFALVVIVTDTQDGVNLGNDGLPHV